PAFYATEGEGALLYNLVEVFGQLLEQTETDLYRVMRSHFVDTADNDGSYGLGSDHPGDLDQIFTLYLDSLGLTAQARQISPGKAALDDLTDAPIALYRQRLKALIKVLRRGAATQQGIRDIVAVNLGIFDDTPDAQKVKEQIKIEEFSPQRITHTFTLHPYTHPAERRVNEPDAEEPVTFEHAQTFTLNNPSVSPSRMGFQLVISDRLLSSNANNPASALLPLTSLRITRVLTQSAQEYTQSFFSSASFTFKGTLRVNDVIRVSADGQLFLNGITLPSQGLPPQLPIGESTWRIEIEVSENPVGQLDQSLFDFSLFDRASEQARYASTASSIQIARFNQSQFDQSTFVTTSVNSLSPELASRYVFSLTTDFMQQAPGQFRMQVPWDIPGCTDKFGEDNDHPRSQIPQIIEKVKAAGVLAIVAYEKRWREEHAHTAQLGVVRSPFTENQTMTETNFDIGSYQEAYPNGLHHDITDSFTTAGMFDYTGFDSGNRFG
ncbi:MAG: hypothetical protein ABG776_20320, partial [Cyanobacteria bacterium J06555_13]